VAGLTEPDGSAPLISVVVTAYNRREYLKRAVDSELCQTLPRDRYEVVVSKNFEFDLDSEWSDLGVKLVFFDRPGLGARVADALRYCKGDVVCLLEDDDVYHQDRLERVLGVWGGRTLYYHSAFEMFTDDGRRLGVFDANPWRNCSSTAVHRWVLTSSEPYLREVRLHLDMFYYIAFRSLGRSDGCVVDTHPTTSVRMHRSPDRSREYAADGEVMRRMLLDRLGSTAALEEIVDHFNLTKKVVGGGRITPREYARYAASAIEAGVHDSYWLRRMAEVSAGFIL
jgi:Glycosyltransferases involved in cell wall biogenesis